MGDIVLAYYFMATSETIFDFKFCQANDWWDLNASLLSVTSAYNISLRWMTLDNGELWRVSTEKTDTYIS